jgi:wyosine [tRNA(Phe)-imidazoG37] synthetase (radical SAM superfamily)
LRKITSISEKLNRGKVEREFQLTKSFYFSEINYDEDESFFDLYFLKNGISITDKQIETYNELIENLNRHFTQIREYIKTTYSNFEIKNEKKLNKRKMNLSVIEISDYNKDFDAVIICEKKYKYFGIFNKNIGIRTEIKNSRIISMERKSDSTKKNKKRFTTPPKLH